MACFTAAANSSGRASIQKVNEAYDRMARGDVKYRFVIDMASLRAE